MLRFRRCRRSRKVGNLWVCESKRSAKKERCICRVTVGERQTIVKRGDKVRYGEAAVFLPLSVSIRVLH